MELIFINSRAPSPSRLLSEKRNEVLKALDWYERHSYELERYDVRNALMRIAGHKDWEIREGVIACLRKRPDDPEFIGTILNRLREEKDHELLESLVAASIMPIKRKVPGHEAATRRIKEIMAGRCTGGALKHQCEYALYWVE
jgi:hypothetical protein